MEQLTKSSSDKVGGPSLAQLERFEAALLSQPQAEYALIHLFAPGVYWREITMYAGTLLIGHEHKTDHFNVVLTGKASVIMEGKVHQIVAPCVFVSKAGIRKVLYIHEDMRWATIHPTNETNIDKLEDDLVIKSKTFLSHKELMTSANKLLEDKST